MIGTNADYFECHMILMNIMIIIVHMCGGLVMNSQCLSSHPIIFFS